jgi:transcriptional regulator with XRE-family HTH domain
MNMKLNSKNIINSDFDDLFKFDSPEEELEHEAKMIMFRFLSEIEKLHTHTPLKKSELAKKLETSASYITQLFNGDKLINLTTLAKLQKVYDITFNVKAVQNKLQYEPQELFLFDSLAASKKQSTDDIIWKNIDKYNKEFLQEIKPTEPYKLRVA